MSGADDDVVEDSRWLASCNPHGTLWDGAELPYFADFNWTQAEPIRKSVVTLSFEIILSVSLSFSICLFGIFLYFFTFTLCKGHLLK